MISSAASTSSESAEPVITDVWSRTGPKYRVRAVVLLLVNVLLYVGVCCFAFWLRTGDAFAMSDPQYWRNLGQTMLPAGEVNLANFVEFPISVGLVPMHGVVVGLLLAALVSIPILISILYGYWCCLPFVLSVAFIAVMPWLAICLAGSCILASVRPFRFTYRYASALLGLVLVLIYFYGASRQSYNPVDPVNPADRIKFMAPWVLATLASCLVMGFVLFLARVVNYRPGAVAPLLLLGLVVPPLLFERFVGRNELHYRLLETQFHETFRDRDLGDWFEALSREAWEQRPSPRPSLDAIQNNMELRMLLEMDIQAEQVTEFARQRARIVAECDWFLRQFPDSRYAPNVLFIKGETLDTRVDLEAFREQRMLKYYTTFPSNASAFTWRRAIANATDLQESGAVAAYARQKMAQIVARRGEVDEAMALSTELIDMSESAMADASSSVPAGAAGAKTGASVLENKPADATLNLPIEHIVFEARQLRRLLRENRHDPRYALRPLCGSVPGEPMQGGLLEFDPRHHLYEHNLKALMLAYPGCLLTDNIALQLALVEEAPLRRIDALERSLTDYPDGDARSEVLFRLGEAYQITEQNGRAKEVFEQLLSEDPDGPWTLATRRRLRVLTAAAATKAEPAATGV